MRTKASDASLGNRLYFAKEQRNELMKREINVMAAMKHRATSKQTDTHKHSIDHGFWDGFFRAVNWRMELSRQKINIVINRRTGVNFITAQ